MKKLFTYYLFLLLLLAPISSAYAIWKVGEPLVPRCNVGETVTSKVKDSTGVVYDSAGKPVMQVGFTQNCDFSQFMGLINNLIDFLLFYFATPLAAIIFVYAGFLLLTSGGNEHSLEKAKHMLTNMIFGYVIALCAWLIINTILNAVGFRGDSFLENSGPSNQPVLTTPATTIDINQPITPGNGGNANRTSSAIIVRCDSRTDPWNNPFSNGSGSNTEYGDTNTWADIDCASDNTGNDTTAYNTAVALAKQKLLSRMIDDSVVEGREFVISNSANYISNMTVSDSQKMYDATSNTSFAWVIVKIPKQTFYTVNPFTGAQYETDSANVRASTYGVGASVSAANDDLVKKLKQKLIAGVAPRILTTAMYQDAKMEGKIQINDEVTGRVYIWGVQSVSKVGGGL